VRVKQMRSKGTQDMTAATAALSFAAEADVAPVTKPSGQRLRAPCLGLALVAGGALWAGIGSTIALMIA
jgi:hypothetical protein